MYDHHGKLIEYFENIEYGVDGHRDAVIVTTGEAKSIPWLRHRNRSDCIYVRPHADFAGRFLLLDDLAPTAAEAHRQRPGRLIVETSPDNFQVWIKFDGHLTYEQKKLLSQVAGGDPDAHPSSTRWGRCPAFINRKPAPKRVNPDGSRFWVRLAAATPGVTVIATLAGILSTPQGPCFSDPAGGGSGSLPGTGKKLSTGRDESRAEYRAACEMLLKGRMTHEQIAEIIAQHAYHRGKRHTLDACRQWAQKLVAGAATAVGRAA